MFERESWYSKLPKETFDVYNENLRLFFHTMYERQMIWKKRFFDKKPKPWTNNKILSEYKFTNVYRDLDKNSQFQIKTIILDEKLTIKNLVWKMMVFRFFNNPKTFQFDCKNQNFQGDLFKKNKLISATKWRNGIPDFDEYDEDEFSDFISCVRSSGQNPYTNAYLINSRATLNHSRDYCYTRVVIPSLHKKINSIILTVKTAKNPEEIIKKFKELPGVSDFIAHEFYQDFTYISKYTNRKFMKFDQNDFTNVGPGASLGLRLIFPSLKSREQKSGIYELKKKAELMLKVESSKNNMKLLFVDWDKKKGEYFLTEKCNITLHQIEMWLCEFQKYWKMLNGVGKQRSKFLPESKNVNFNIIKEK